MISHSPAACVYHPARTMSLLHGIEFDEARAQMAVALPELALGGSRRMSSRSSSACPRT